MHGVMVQGLLPPGGQDPVVVKTTAISEGDAMSQPRVNSITFGFGHVNTIFITIKEILATFLMDTFGLSSLPSNNARIRNKLDVEVIGPNTGGFAATLHIGDRAMLLSSRKQPLNLGRNCKTLLSMDMTFHPL